MEYKYPLATSSWDNREIDAINRVINSGMFSMGKEVKAFEKSFAEYFGSQYAVMVNSGSSANLLMASALLYTTVRSQKLERGDEVIVPAVSWSTTYYPLSQCGFHLKFVDIDPLTLNYDLDALNAAISEKTKCIMVVNLLGNPNNFDRISEIVGERDIIILEDNCESMGATFNGKQAGTFGLMGSFSLFFSHHISTMEGGMVLTDNEELYHILLSLRAHGWTRDLPEDNKITGKKSNDSFYESFRFILPGYNLRPLEMSGALGQEQLKKLPSLIEGRRSNGQLFQDKMADHQLFEIQEEIGESSWFGFSLVIKQDCNVERSTVLKALGKLGFECRPIVSGNFAKNEVMKHIDHSIHGKLTNADHVDSRGLFIGNHHYSIEDAVNVLSRIGLNELTS